MLVRLKKALAVLLSFYMVVGLADEPNQLNVLLKLNMSYTTEQMQGVRAQTVMARLVPGFAKTYGDSFPKLQLVVLADQEESDVIEVSLVGEDGKVLSSTVIYLQSDIGAEFALHAEGLDGEGSISRR